MNESYRVLLNGSSPFKKKQKWALGSHTHLVQASPKVSPQTSVNAIRVLSKPCSEFFRNSTLSLLDLSNFSRKLFISFKSQNVKNVSFSSSSPMYVFTRTWLHHHHHHSESDSEPSERVKLRLRPSSSTLGPRSGLNKYIIGGRRTDKNSVEHFISIKSIGKSFGNPHIKKT